jgi:hypothetical protein
MIDAALVITIIALICLIAVTQYTGIKEREKLLKLFMAKDLKEVTDNEYTQKIKPQKTEPPEFADITEDETIFDKAIKAQLEYGKQISPSPHR